MLTSHMKEHRLNFPVGVVGSDCNVPLRYPLGRAEQYSHVGVVHTMDEVFEAPNMIKRFLADLTAIDRILILQDNANIEEASICICMYRRVYAYACVPKTFTMNPRH